MVDETLTIGMKERSLGRVGLIGRFKPLHNGAKVLLETACENADHVVIGIGSANKYNARNPFTVKETEDMIKLALVGFNNYEIVAVPDFAQIPGYEDGKKWKDFVFEKFQQLDYFITGNPFVAQLLGERYEVIHPCEIIPREKWIKLRAAEVRTEIAKYGEWETLVPKEVAGYIAENGLDERMRKQFGLEILANLVYTDVRKSENAEQELLHAREA